MQYVYEYFRQVVQIWQEVAPWLLLGLIVAGLIHVFLPAGRMSRWLGGRGLGSVWKAALLGTPLPLCSCSVLPAAVALRRGGASRGATVSFLVATPENGADSLAVSYVLLGPLMTIARLVGAIVSAVSTGTLAELVDGCNSMEATPPDTTPPGPDTTCCHGTSGCESPVTEAACHGSDDTDPSSLPQRFWFGLRYAMTDLLTDIAPWTAVGILAAAAISTFVPPDAMAQQGSGLVAMSTILLIGIPMYICATASTPVAASLLAAGVSPGTVLVFLLAGPATNIGSIGIIGREIGTRAVVVYLAGISVCSICLGLLLDQWLMLTNGVVDPQMSGHVRMVPGWLSLAAAMLLPLFAIRPLVRRIGG